MIRQVTRMLAEALAKATKAEVWLHTTLKSIGDAVIATDQDGRVVFMNSVAEDLTQWPAREALHKPLIEIFNIVNQQTRAPVHNPVLTVLEKGITVGLANHTVLIGKDGKECVIEDSAAPIRNTAGGKLEGVVLVFRDSTDKYVQQEQIREAFETTRSSEASLVAVLENALDAVIVMDSEGIVMQWNTQAEKSFGFARTEAIGRRLSELIIPLQHRERHEQGMQRYKSTGHGPVLNKRIEITALNREELEFPVELTITPIWIGRMQVFYGFIRDISDRKQSEKKLLDAIKSRDDFLSIASHELKTPLTSLKLQAQMRARRVQRGDTNTLIPENMLRATEGELRQLDRLARLIDEMLDISRIGTGKFLIEKEPFELCALVKEVFGRFVEQFDAAKCKANFVSCDVIEGSWDRLKMEQVVTNLLTNAIKYGAGKPIDVGLAQEGSLAVLTVRDYGRGIAMQDQDRIFERFERAISASEVSGMGLGLYIAKQIVLMHGGTITVHSELGQGSSFIVRIPVAPTP